MGALTQSIWQRLTTVILQLYCSHCIQTLCSMTYIESMGIGLIVHQCKALLGQAPSIPHLIKYICSLLEFERQSFTPVHRTYCMIMGNYGGHLAYAMDPPFCMAFALDFINKNDPATMTFRNQENHPVSFKGDGLIICQLLAWDCMEHKYERTTHNRCLLIPRGMCSSLKSFFQRYLFRGTMLHHTLTPKQ